LDHEELLKLFIQHVDPEGETLDATILVMVRRLDLERCANILKLHECALEKFDGKADVDGLLLLLLIGRRWLLPLLLDGQLPPMAAFVVVIILPSFLLRRQQDEHRDVDRSINKNYVS
jgi:hypothetical protein